MNDTVRVHLVQEKDRQNLTMRYRDPITGRQVKRSAETSNRKEAERRAHKWEAEINEGRYRAPSKISWEEFRQRYENEKLSSLAQGTRDAAASALNHLERVISPERMTALTSGTMSRFQADLRKEGMRDTTIDAHLGHIQAALNWAVSTGMLPKMPSLYRPKRVKGRKLMRGRPITAEEFERMLATVPNVREHDTETWQHYLNGLWLSGLRLEESLVLSWGLDSPFAVDLSGKRPRFRIYAEAEKGNRDRLLPMTPDFAEWLLQAPVDEQHGPVFKVIGMNTGTAISAKRVSRIITKFGKKAGVVVDRTRKKVKEKILHPKTGKPTGKTRLIEKEVIKYASAHDFRRAFGTRWAKKVMPAVLRQLMRHRSIDTTMAYYVDLEADDVADELWAKFGADQVPGGTILGTNGNSDTQEAGKGSRPASNGHPYPETL